MIYAQKCTSGERKRCSEHIIRTVQRTLTVFERALITPRAGMFCIIDMYLLYIYRTREIVREAFGDCQTYRTSLSMQRSASYASSAVRLSCQYAFRLQGMCSTARGRTRNHNVEGVFCPPTRGHE